jgi:hypothetical protein
MRYMSRPNRWLLRGVAALVILLALAIAAFFVWVYVYDIPVGS